MFVFCRGNPSSFPQQVFPRLASAKHVLTSRLHLCEHDKVLKFSHWSRTLKIETGITTSTSHWSTKQCASVFVSFKNFCIKTQISWDSFTFAVICMSVTKKNNSTEIITVVALKKPLLSGRITAIAVNQMKSTGRITAVAVNKFLK